MAWTLAEFSKIETDPLRKSIMDTLLMNTPVMELIPWETIGALSTNIIRIQDLPSVGYRRINGSFGESTGHLEQKAETISILGGNIDTDKAIARAKNTVADARAIQQVMKLKSIAYHFNNRLINGSVVVDADAGDNPGFEGLKVRVNDLYDEGYTGQKISAGDIFVLADAANQNTFLDKLDELMYAIDGHQPDFLFMNHKTLLAVRSTLRRLQVLTTSVDMFDRRVDMYQSARLIDIGTTADQSTEIILNTESTVGADTGGTASSIYAVKFGIGDLMWGIEEYPMEVEDLGLLQALPLYRTTIDWPLGLAVANPRAIARLYNFKPSVS